MSKNKKTVSAADNVTKIIPNNALHPNLNSEQQVVLWSFDKTDKEGDFCFSSKELRNYSADILRFLMSVNSQKWHQIRKTTHDGGKSKHHFLDWDSLSQKAKKRIEKLHLNEDADRIFSFALNNTLRVIGIRDQYGVFHAVWLDPHHAFCPSHKK